MLEAIGYNGWALHALIWLPVLGMAQVLWEDEARAKHIALAWSVLVFVLSLGLWWRTILVWAEDSSSRAARTGSARGA